MQLNCSLCPRTDHFSAGCDPGPLARNPPSTMIFDPDTNEAPSEAANKIAGVVSRTFPMRPSGCILANCFRISGVIPASPKTGVSIAAGLINQHLN